MRVAEGRVGGDGDVGFFVRVDEFGLLEVGMRFELVDFRFDGCGAEKVVYLGDVEIGYADEACSLSGDEFLHITPCLHAHDLAGLMLAIPNHLKTYINIVVCSRPIGVADRKVHERQVEVIKTKLIKVHLHAFFDFASMTSIKSVIYRCSRVVIRTSCSISWK